MAKIDPNYPYDVYQFLAKPLRDADASGLLERFTGAFQTVLENTDASTMDLLDLYDIDLAPDWALDYLLWHVGWTKELDYITDSLTADQKRKLLRLSAQMWKMKGTETGIKQAIRLFTGKEAIGWNWFYLRAEVDVVATGYSEATGTDFWLVGSDYGDRDEYLSIYWVTATDADERALIEQLMAIQKPMGEAFRVNYPDYVDDFQLDSVPRWTTLSGSAATWASGTFQLVIPASTVTEPIDVGLALAEDVTYLFSYQFTDAAGLLRFHFRSSSSAANGYRFEVDNAGKTAKLIRLVAGVPTTIATATLDASFNVDWSLGVVIHVSQPTASTLHIRVELDSESVADVTESGGSVQPAGTVSWASAGTGSITLDNIIIYERPMAYAIVA